ncbi:MAG: hypothetical protein QOK28_1105 [Actinomycetota bacterium]|jgi:flavorubredoxin
MDTRIDEVADGIYQIATYMPEMDFGFNQYLIAGDEPVLFHTGMRGVFPIVREHVAKVLPPETLRWISFGHVEADECGSMNEWLAVAPNATVIASTTACMVQLGDLCDRQPTPLADGADFTAGARTLRWYDTPHIPHGWEAGVLYDATSKTLFCGDLLSCTGNYEATTDTDRVGPASAAEDMFHSFSLAPNSATRVRQLAELDISALAIMHGPVYTGDCREALLGLADDLDKRIAAAS